VSEQRFEATMQRVRRRLAAARGAPDAARHVVIATVRGQRVIPLDDIEWIGADDYYVAIYTERRRHLLRETMASLESRLDPARFVRVHRGAIVSIAHIREVRSADGDTVVVLRDGTRLPVSRRRRAALASALR
jgi:two-component system LytT family response regulator